MKKLFCLITLLLLTATACFAGAPPIGSFPGAPDPATHPWLMQQLKKDRYPCPTQSSPFMGPADAPVTINEFLDYQCPSCVEQDKVLKKLVHDYPKEVKLVIKNLPLTDIHNGALSRAKVAQAMANQDKFWQAHDQFLKGANSDQVMSHGDKDQLKAYWSKGGDGQVDKDIATAKHLGLNMTPSFVINGIRIGGTIGYEQLKLLVDYEIARKNAIARAKAQQKPGSSSDEQNEEATEKAERQAQ